MCSIGVSGNPIATPLRPSATRTGPNVCPRFASSRSAFSMCGGGRFGADIEASLGTPRAGGSGGSRARPKWETLRVDKPEIHYARSGTVYVGYQAFGSGPFDLVVVPGALSNIDYGWEFESWRNYYGALASIARVLLFDKRGTGISDPVLGAPSLEERMDDVRAVMDAVGSERAALIGSWDGAAIAALFAATHPERRPPSFSTVLSFAGDGRPTTRGEAETSPTASPRLRPTGQHAKPSKSRLPRKCPVGRATRSSHDRSASYVRLSASPTTFAKLLEMNLASTYGRRSQRSGSRRS